MYTPHTVTVYNVVQETDIATFDEIERVYITVLRGVFLDATKARNVNESGMVSADAVDLFIPFSVNAVDGTSGTEKTYVGPQAFWALTDEQRADKWTLSVEGDGGETFFVKGEVVTNVNIARAHDDSYTVTKIDTKDFGRASMQHWQVGGA